VRKENAYGFWLGNLKEINHLEDLTVDGRILEWILEIRWEGVDWINLALGSGRWRALVKMVMDLLVP